MHLGGSSEGAHADEVSTAIGCTYLTQVPSETSHALSKRQTCDFLGVNRVSTGIAIRHSRVATRVRWWL